MKDSTFTIEYTKKNWKFIYQYKKISYRDKKDYIKIKYEELKKYKNIEFLPFLNFLKILEKEPIALQEYNNFKFYIEFKFNSIKSDNGFFDIKCIYKLGHEQIKFIDENIHKDHKGFNLLIDEIINKIDSGNSSDNEYNIYSIIEYKEIIGDHIESAEFIKELSNGYFLSGSIDHKLNIYDQSQKKINQIIDLRFTNNGMYANSICEIYSNKNFIQIIACSKEALYFIELNLNNFQYEIYNKNLEKIYCNQCIKISNNNYIILGGNGIYQLKNIQDQKNIRDENLNISTILSGKSYINGIKINKNTIAISSNSVCKMGEDKLIFYNLEQIKITHEIEIFHLSNY